MTVDPTGVEVQSKSDGRDWIKIGLCFTVLWVVALAVGILWGTQQKWLQAVPLELNALGDFLAGIFAPLAFLWLFVATMVQSQELQAQRQELNLTRQEFKLSRGVAEQARDEIKAQVEVARQTAAFMEAQTKAAEKQVRIADDDKLKADFDKILSDLIVAIRRQGSVRTARLSDIREEPQRRQVVVRSVDASSDDTAIFEAIESARIVLGTETVESFDHRSMQALREIIDIINDLMVRAESGPPILGMRVKNMNLHALHQSYQRVLEMSDAFAKEPGDEQPPGRTEN